MAYPLVSSVASIKRTASSLLTGFGVTRLIGAPSKMAVSFARVMSVSFS